MGSILISGAYCILPDGEEKRSDIYIENGRICAISDNVRKSADRYINGESLVAMPALFDMHVHFRDPGYTYKEDIFTGTAAAIAGGFSGAACMPNTKPVCDNADVLSYIFDRSTSAEFKVYPIVCTTKGMQGKEICDYAELKKCGAIAVSDDGRPVADENIMEKALISAYNNGMPIISHCEDLDIIDGGIINKGTVSEMLGVKGMDRESENSITEREILLAEKTDTAIHIAHVSTKESVELVRKAKQRGVKVTCETCPHYFCLTDELLTLKDADYRMNPPLREEADRIAVIEGLLDNTIDCIVTDHAPHSANEKADFLSAPNGIVGLETSLAATLTELYHKNGFTLSHIYRLMSLNPRRILNLPVCELKVNSCADIVLFDLNCRWRIETNKLKSKSKNTAFKHMIFTGKPVMTIINGKIRYENI